jgi:CRISPR system Cascade subunit CasE
MFLSKVTLNPRHRLTYRLVSDLYAQHRFVMTAFPDGKGTEDKSKGTQSNQGVLYRLETLSQSDVFFFLVQSLTAPDWTKTETLHPNMVCRAESKEDRRTYSEGGRYRFRLRASPTICKVNRDAEGVRQKPQRTGLFAEEEQRAWLVRTGERCGFRIVPEAVLITPRGKREGQKPPGMDERQGHTITCFTVDYDGILIVTDTERFLASLREGVGRGKAWGCGLLSLARA